MLKFVNTKIDKSNYKLIKELYEASFPKDEQVPFFLLKLNARKSISDIFAIYDNDRYIGFFINVYHEDIVFVWYLALINDLRGKGYGSMILDKISTIYKEYRIILNIEEIDKDNINYQEQVNRKNFYIKNGFKQCGYKTEEYGVIYEMYYKNNNVCYEEYIKMMEKYSIKTLIQKNYRKIDD